MQWVNFERLDALGMEIYRYTAELVEAERDGGDDQAGPVRG